MIYKVILTIFQLRQVVYDSTCEMNVSPPGPALKFGSQWLYML